MRMIWPLLAFGAAAVWWATNRQTRLPASTPVALSNAPTGDVLVRVRYAGSLGVTGDDPDEWNRRVNAVKQTALELGGGYGVDALKATWEISVTRPWTGVKRPRAINPGFSVSGPFGYATQAQRSNPDPITGKPGPFVDVAINSYVAATT